MTRHILSLNFSEGVFWINSKDCAAWHNQGFLSSVLLLSYAESTIKLGEKIRSAVTIQRSCKHAVQFTMSTWYLIVSYLLNLIVYEWEKLWLLKNLKLDFLVPCASFHTFPAASREQEYEAVVRLPLPLVWGTSSQCQLAGGTSSGLLGVWSLLPGASICQIFESGVIHRKRPNWIKLDKSTIMVI